MSTPFLLSSRTVEVDAGGGVVLILLAVFMILGIAALGVWIWALVDAIQVPDDSMYRAGTKLVWVLVIVFLQVIGAVIYFAIGRPAKGTASPPPRGPGGLPPPPS
ncbi:MAG: PLDc N-terminal domain-containing protein [Actinomycetota bacterium]